MMQIPEYFENKIVGVYGDRGVKWLADLPGILDGCAKKWQLTDLGISGDLSFNLICFARSQVYGDVALKVGMNRDELRSEMGALSVYGGKITCACYDSDMEFGAILLERIMSGENLSSLQNNQAQLDIAADLIVRLPAPIGQDQEFKTYSGWVDRAFRIARERNIVGDRLLQFIDIGEKMFVEFESVGRPKLLLHGDLHHWNILKNKNGDWKVIDPKGVVGTACLEAARFMENQLSMVSGIDRVNHLDEMVTVFGSKFAESKRTIACGLFILCVLSTCWTFEDANPDQMSISELMDKCELVLGYINSL